MKSIEISARSVAEAVELALAQLGKDRDEVVIAILEPGDGMVEEALVRVSVAEEDEENPSVPSLHEVRRDDDGAEDACDADDNSTDGVVARARSLLDGLLSNMDIHAYVTAVKTRVPAQYGESEEESITLHIEGADEQAMGLLIGRRGETLHSVQFLLNMMVSRKIHRWPHLVVDVGNYRQRRRESLEGLARRVAERVQQSGRAFTLEPMPPYERRIVHLALRSDEQVYTQSSGEGDNRKVVIHPR